MQFIVLLGASRWLYNHNNIGSTPQLLLPVCYVLNPLPEVQDIGIVGLSLSTDIQKKRREPRVDRNHTSLPVCNAVWLIYSGECCRFTNPTLPHLHLQRYIHVNTTAARTRRTAKQIGGPRFTGKWWRLALRTP